MDLGGHEVVSQSVWIDLLPVMDVKKCFLCGLASPWSTLTEQIRDFSFLDRGENFILMFINGFF